MEKPLNYDVIYKIQHNDILYYICKDCRYPTDKRASMLLHLKTPKHLYNVKDDEVNKELTDEEQIEIINEKNHLSNLRLCISYKKIQKERQKALRRKNAEIKRLEQKKKKVQVLKTIVEEVEDEDEEFNTISFY